MGSHGSQGTAIPVVEIELTPQCLLNTLVWLWLAAGRLKRLRSKPSQKYRSVYPQKFTVLVDARQALLHHKNVHFLLGNWWSCKRMEKNESKQSETEDTQAWALSLSYIFKKTFHNEQRRTRHTLWTGLVGSDFHALNCSIACAYTPEV